MDVAEVGVFEHVLDALRVHRRLRCRILARHLPDRPPVLAEEPILPGVAVEAAPGLHLDDRDAVWPDEQSINITALLPGRRRTIPLQQHVAVVELRRQRAHKSVLAVASLREA